MRVDEITAARMTGKLSKLSLFAAVYRRRDTLYSACTDDQKISSPRGRDSLMNYIKEHVNVSTADELNGNLIKHAMDRLEEAWTKDMEGIWGTAADKVVQSGSTVTDCTWMEAKDQLVKTIQIIRDAKWDMIMKRPYTEVCFAADVYNIISDHLMKVYPPVREAKVAFEVLEKKAIDQIEKDVSALAEAMDGLSSSSESLSGSQIM
jgi:hypothetical protein